MRSRPVLPLGPRRAAVALWCVGAALAASTGVFSAAHGDPRFAGVYGVVAVGLLVLAAATRSGRAAAQWISLVGLGGQTIGAIGAGWELHDPDLSSAKARHLRDLGINFRWALAANLLYSLVAATVFLWAIVARRRTAGERLSHSGNKPFT